ncbi:MAG: hypothetical protein K2H84_06750 [Paramuribaculum sp.]|nr:hypothetical protein [Paramuribaculum sp.]
MKTLLESGVEKRIGVPNYNLVQIKCADEALAAATGVDTTWSWENPMA